MPNTILLCAECRNTYLRPLILRICRLQKEFVLLISRINLLFIVLGLYMAPFNLEAQDPHFSQFYTAPLVFNPALAGTYEGTFRAGAIYRDQWTSALADPLSTMMVTGDVSFDIASKTKKVPDKFAVGISFYSDRVSTFDLNTNQISLYGAYHKVLDERTRQYISGGLQIGMMQRSINYEDLRFGDQFNSIDGYTLNTGEILPANNLGHFDMGLGINYSRSPKGGTQFYLGAALFHVTGTNISFYRDDIRVDDNLVRSNELNRKITAQAGMSQLISRNLEFQPRVLYMNQGPHNMVNVGSNFRFRLESTDNTFLHFGPWLRGASNIDGFALESLVMALAYEKGNFILGFSYDHSYDDIITDRTGLNAFEISLTFIGEHDNDSNICPKF
jgi:type IX secretion system PorP/SprF family membrane protein